MLILGVAGLGVSITGVAMQVLPRRFTTHQQQQILGWEVASRWRTRPAGDIFRASVRYPPPSALGSGSLSLTANLIGIARQASCTAATDPEIAAVLNRNGCQAVLRATYADGTDSYVVTVGVAAFPGTAQAAAAERELAGPTLTSASAAGAQGVRTVPFQHTPAAWFVNQQRQISAHQRAASYVIFYAVGYADDRPFEPGMSSDRYVYAEMTCLGAGVSRAVESVLAAQPPQPHCPGTPGC